MPPKRTNTKSTKKEASASDTASPVQPNKTIYGDSDDDDDEDDVPPPRSRTNKKREVVSSPAESSDNNDDDKGLEGQPPWKRKPGSPPASPKKKDDETDDEEWEHEKKKSRKKKTALPAQSHRSKKPKKTDDETEEHESEEHESDDSTIKTTPKKNDKDKGKKGKNGKKGKSGKKGKNGENEEKGEENDGKGANKKKKKDEDFPPIVTVLMTNPRTDRKEGVFKVVGGKEQRGAIIRGPAHLSSSWTAWRCQDHPFNTSLGLLLDPMEGFSMEAYECVYQELGLRRKDIWFYRCPPLKDSPDGERRGAHAQWTVAFAMDFTRHILVACGVIRKSIDDKEADLLSFGYNTLEVYFRLGLFRERGQFDYTSVPGSVEVVEEAARKDVFKHAVHFVELDPEMSDARHDQFFRDAHEELGIACDHYFGEILEKIEILGDWSYFLHDHTAASVIDRHRNVVPACLTCRSRGAPAEEEEPLAAEGPEPPADVTTKKPEEKPENTTAPPAPNNKKEEQRALFDKLIIRLVRFAKHVGACKFCSVSLVNTVQPNIKLILLWRLFVWIRCTVFTVHYNDIEGSRPYHLGYHHHGVNHSQLDHELLREKVAGVRSGKYWALFKARRCHVERFYLWHERLHCKPFLECIDLVLPPFVQVPFVLPKEFEPAPLVPRVQELPPAEQPTDVDPKDVQIDGPASSPSKTPSTSRQAAAELRSLDEASTAVPPQLQTSRSGTPVPARAPIDDTTVSDSRAPHISASKTPLTSTSSKSPSATPSLDEHFSAQMQPGDDLDFVPLNNGQDDPPMEQKPEGIIQNAPDVKKEPIEAGEKENDQSKETQKAPEVNSFPLKHEQANIEDSAAVEPNEQSTTNCSYLLLALRGPLAAIRSASIDDLLMSIDEKIRNSGNKQFALQNVSIPLTACLFVLKENAVPDEHPEEESTSLLTFLIGLRAGISFIQHSTMDSFHQELDDLIQELIVQDKRIPVEMVLRAVLAALLIIAP